MDGYGIRRVRWNRRASFVLLLFCLACPEARATTWHVATSGSDATGDGTAAAPFATPQKGLDAAMPGDVVQILPGKYRGVMSFPRSGTAAARITLAGEPGAELDGGVVIAGWELDPVMGKDGVYRRRTADLPFPPFHMTWDDKYVLRLNHGQAKLAASESYYARLTAPPEDKAWDGVEALFGTRDDFTYVRFRDRQNPNEQKVTFGRSSSSADSGVVNIVGKSFVTVRGFTIKGGGTGVNVCRGASDVVVEGNLVMHGRNGVFINGQGAPPVPCHRVAVRGNRITLNYVVDLSPRNPLHGYIWSQFKEASDTDRRAVYLFYGGDDCEVSGNEIYQHWDGVQDSAGGATRAEYAEFSRRLKVHDNVFRELADDALEPTGGEIDAEWHDNLCTDALISLRLKDVKVGPCYVYRNRFNGGPGAGGGNIVPRDLFYFAGSDGTVYLYHNTFASETGLVMGSTTRERGLPNTWFINNVFSNAKFWSNGEKWAMDGHFHYNWCGGDAQRHPWMAADNFVAPGQRLWKGGKAEFVPAADSPVLRRGIDLSKTVTLDGTSVGLLPGMKPGYFRGDRPDLGAVQVGPEVPPADVPR